MRIQELDREGLARIITNCEREIMQMKTAQRVGADGVRVFRLKLETTIAKRDSAFLRRFRVVFTPADDTYKSGIVFKLMVGRKNTHTSRLDDATIYFRRQRTRGTVQTWELTSDLLSEGSGDSIFKIYAFATSDGTLSIEYI